MNIIYHAVLRAVCINSEHESLLFSEYGANRAVLVARLDALCTKIAPFTEWDYNAPEGAPGSLFEVEHITVGQTGYEAEFREITLTC